MSGVLDSEQASYDSHEVRAEVLTYGPNAKAFYKQLEAEKAAIEKEVGQSLIWYEGGGKQSRIYLRKPAKLDDRTKWQSECEWLMSSLEKLHKVFGTRVRGLKAAGQTAGE